jgi:PAT family beta-lactamase induction signal transducer AmpG
MNKRIFIVFLLGFSSGLPFALVGSTLQAWYAVDGLSILAIGMLSLVGQPYVYRFLWAPFMDMFVPNRLGRRRGWIIITQTLLVCGFFIISLLKPSQTPWIMAILALLLAFFSASQDIAIDAYRTEILLEHEHGLGASAAVLGYRLATLISGGMALVIAQYWGWVLTYQLMAGLMIPAMIVTYRATEPVYMATQNSTKINFSAPFKELLFRPKAISVFIFIFLYKLGEAFTSTSSGIVTAFLIQGLHFDLATVGLINKVFGIASIMIGSLVAGIIMLRLSLFNALLIFGILQAVTNIVFISLASVGKNIELLTLAVVSDNIAAGMGTTALVAMLMWWCNKEYTGTQFALLTACASLPRVLSGPLAGLVQPMMGWVHFYELAFALALPCLVMLFIIKPIFKIGTGGGNRTHTVSPPPDFESGASTSSATSARKRL